MNDFILEELESRSWVEMLEAAPSWFGVTCERTPSFSVLRCDGLAGEALYNRSIALAVPQPGEIENVLSRYHGNLKVQLQISPQALNESVSGELKAHSLNDSSGWAKLWRDAVHIEPLKTEFEIREVFADRASDFAIAARTGFGLPEKFDEWFGNLVGLPDWRFLAAYDSAGRPVAAGALRLQGKWAWLGIGGTAPEARRRGAQNALIAARISLAYQLGCNSVGVETGDGAQTANPSLNNLSRQGFKIAYRRGNYIFGQTKP